MPSMTHAELMTAYREEAGASPWLTFIKAALTIRDHGVGSKAGAVYDAHSLMGSCVVVLNGAPTAFFGGVNRDPAAATYPDDTRDRAAIPDAMAVVAALLAPLEQPPEKVADLVATITAAQAEIDADDAQPSQLQMMNGHERAHVELDLYRAKLALANMQLQALASPLSGVVDSAFAVIEAYGPVNGPLRDLSEALDKAFPDDLGAVSEEDEEEGDDLPESLAAFMPGGEGQRFGYVPKKEG